MLSTFLQTIPCQLICHKFNNTAVKHEWQHLKVLRNRAENVPFPCTIWVISFHKFDSLTNSTDVLPRYGVKFCFLSSFPRTVRDKNGNWIE